MNSEYSVVGEFYGYGPMMWTKPGCDDVSTHAAFSWEL